MSVYITGSIWKHGPSKPNQRYVLLAIGDNCNDEGYAYPSIGTISDKSCLSKRQVMRVIQELEDGGWLVVNRDELQGKGNTYQLNLSKIQVETRVKTSGDKMTRDKKSGSQVTFATDSGDIYDIAIRKNRQEPSIEPSEDVLPSWIPREEWNNFLEMRVKMKKPMTGRAKQLTVGKLDGFRKQGFSVRLILQESIMNSWQGVFAPKNGNGNKPRLLFGKPAYTQDVDEAITELERQKHGS